MLNFQKMVLLIFVLLFLYFMGMVYYSLKRSKTNPNWPPNIPQCPDYWELSGSGDNYTCVNIKDLGTCTAASGDRHQTMDFNSREFNGANPECEKYTWATKCNISWDGITYGRQNPCDTTI